MSLQHSISLFGWVLVGEKMIHEFLQLLSIQAHINRMGMNHPNYKKKGRKNISTIISRGFLQGIHSKVWSHGNKVSSACIMVSTKKANG